MFDAPFCQNRIVMTEALGLGLFEWMDNLFSAKEN